MFYSPVVMVSLLYGIFPHYEVLILRPAALFFCVILRPATCGLALYIYEKNF